jgi:hypothetical protein
MNVPNNDYNGNCTSKKVTVASNAFQITVLETHGDKCQNVGATGFEVNACDVPLLLTSWIQCNLLILCNFFRRQTQGAWEWQLPAV